MRRITSRQSDSIAALVLVRHDQRGRAQSPAAALQPSSHARHASDVSDVGLRKHVALQCSEIGAEAVPLAPAVESSSAKGVHRSKMQAEETHRQQPATLPKGVEVPGSSAPAPQPADRSPVKTSFAHRHRGPRGTEEQQQDGVSARPSVQAINLAPAVEPLTAKRVPCSKIQAEEPQRQQPVTLRKGSHLRRAEAQVLEAGSKRPAVATTSNAAIGLHYSGPCGTDGQQQAGTKDKTRACVQEAAVAAAPRGHPPPSAGLELRGAAPHREVPLEGPRAKRARGAATEALLRLFAPP